MGAVLPALSFRDTMVSGQKPLPSTAVWIVRPGAQSMVDKHMSETPMIPQNVLSRSLLPYLRGM